MQPHPKDSEVLVLDTIAEARVFNPGWLRRRFNPILPKAAIHTDEKLQEFCRSVDYERDGLTEVFGRNREGVSHSLAAIYNRGQVDFIYFSTLIHERVGEICPQFSKKAFHEPGLHQYYGRWNQIFKQYGDYIRPAFGPEFEIRMVARNEPEIRLHTDHKRYDKIACTPLGDKGSTIVQAMDGSLIEPEDMSTVITRRGTVHSSPASKTMRAIISANSFERDSLTGLVPGLGA